MRSFEDYDPITGTIIILLSAGVSMFCTEPVIQLLSLIGAVSYFSARRKKTGSIRTHITFLILFLILSAANPLVSHNGVTVLMVVNDNPITLEALLYGINSSVMMISVLYWLRSFSDITTSEKLLYITGAFSPKLSLLISMSVRFVPMFRRQAEKTSDAQRTMGLYRDENVIDRLLCTIRVFSAVVTWALETGIITAESMDARGYGTGRRTCFSVYRMRGHDIILLAAGIILSSVCITAYASGKLGMNFYPSLSRTRPDILGTVGLICYGILVMLPFAAEIGARLKWKYLMSEI
ncbi:MAG: cobalt transport protein [Oscillospiraceae bacterium]|nr:cobalt transport protein [Oscillospiraceae bacterium]